MAAMIPVYGVAYASILVAPVLVVPVLFLNRAVRTVTSPVVNQYLNERLDDVGRATVLSGASMALALVGGGARLVAGRGAELLGAVGFLPWAGVALSLAGAVVWVAVDPVRVGGSSEQERQERVATGD